MEEVGLQAGPREFADYVVTGNLLGLKHRKQRGSATAGEAGCFQARHSLDARYQSEKIYSLKINYSGSRKHHPRVKGFWKTWLGTTATVVQ